MTYMNSDLNVAGELISWFDDLGSGNDQTDFLSNFYEGAPIVLPGVTWSEVIEQISANTLADAREDILTELWAILDLDASSFTPTGPVEFPTGEHAFAAMKAWNTDWLAFARMATAPTPGAVKAIGRSCKLREDWEVVKLDVMAATVRAKFTLDREEGQRLLETGDALLIEGTFWGDDVWGVDLKGRDATTSWGSNWLGTLLMARRAELRAQSLFGHSTRAGEKNAKTAVDGWQKPAWMK